MSVFSYRDNGDQIAQAQCKQCTYSRVTTKFLAPDYQRLWGMGLRLVDFGGQQLAILELLNLLFLKSTTMSWDRWHVVLLKA